MIEVLLVGALPLYDYIAVSWIGPHHVSTSLRTPTELCVTTPPTCGRSCSGSKPRRKKRDAIPAEGRTVNTVLHVVSLALFVSRLLATHCINILSGIPEDALLRPSIWRGSQPRMLGLDAVKELSDDRWCGDGRTRHEQGRGGWLGCDDCGGQQSRLGVTRRRQPKGRGGSMAGSRV
ncbi:hypothetical protein BD410DRAFT_307226 [Rickenella mellea]|uniref:Uncharacterized protein n=1 Tax=Rickenella mellea TaxID=50990 RepID=A0A4Y7Q1J1_9AGAM|nr:hypothetical protein BD410DRAFT_307226 [Rickenella mellea]